MAQMICEGKKCNGHGKAQFCEVCLNHVLKLRQACEVCWTISWVPVLDDDPDAQKLLNGKGSVRCDYCWLSDQYRKLKESIK